METGLIIYFVALAVLAGVFLKISIVCMKTKCKDDDERVASAWMMIIFFISFVITMSMIAETGYNLAFPELSAFPPWLQEHWS